MNNPNDSIYSYLKTTDPIYTPDYFAPLQVEIFHTHGAALVPAPQPQTGAFFNYFFTPTQPAAANQNAAGLAPLETFIFFKTAAPPAPLQTNILTIYNLEILAKTLCIQIKFHEKFGRTFDKITDTDIFFTAPNNFIFFPTSPPNQNDAPANTQQNAHVVGTFLNNLYEKSAAAATARPLQTNKLFFFITRAIKDKQLLWV